MDLNDLYKRVAPINARLFMESLLGKTTPITEKDFSNDELDVIKNQGNAKYVREPEIRRAMYDANVKAGFEGGDINRSISPQVGYADYSPRPDSKNWAEAVYKSYTDPRYRIATSLGNFGLVDRGDHYKAFDTYNWNGDFDRPIKSLSDLWKYSEFSKPTSVLNGLAELYAPKVSRKVDIRVQK